MQRITFYTFLLIYIFSRGILKSNAQTDDLLGLRFKDDRIKNIWLSSVAICNFVFDASKNFSLGSGSGTLIHPDGWILTAAHVVNKSDITSTSNLISVLYQLGYNKYFYQKADTCISDSTHDIAIIKINIPDEHKNLT